MSIQLRPLLHKDEIDRHDEAKERCAVVPMQSLALEKARRKDREHNESDNLLYHLQLQKGERSAVFHIADAVCRHLEQVFKERDRPPEHYHRDKRQFGKPAELLFHLQVSVPCEGHKYVGNDQQRHCI